MKVIVATDLRGVIDREGRSWVGYPAGYDHWCKYLEVFDQVQVMARLEPVASVPGDFLRIDGELVSVAAVPYFVGPREYLVQRKSVFRLIQSQLRLQAAVLLKAPGQVASVTSSVMQVGRPYGIEVVGDPYEVFAPGVVSHPLRRYFRWRSVYQLRNAAQRAVAVRYVSGLYLPVRYPSAPSSLAVVCSDIELLDLHFRQPAREELRDQGYALVTVGSLEQLYKGIDVLLEAVAFASRDLSDLTLRIVGDGRYRHELELLANRLSIADRVTFVGQLPGGDAVRAELDRATLFVMASRTEGLPRAMIEAMARGRPCIGTTVGGIPELLSPEDMVPSNDSKALAAKIVEVLGDPSRMRAMSERNLAKAAEYRDDILRVRRNEFYRHVRDSTEEWMRGTGRA